MSKLAKTTCGPIADGGMHSTAIRGIFIVRGAPSHMGVGVPRFGIHWEDPLLRYIMVKRHQNQQTAEAVGDQPGSSSLWSHTGLACDHA